MYIYIQAGIPSKDETVMTTLKSLKSRPFIGDPVEYIY